MERFISLLGLLVMIFIAFALSDNKKKIYWKTIVGGVLLQFIFGVIILKTSFGVWVFEWAKNFFNAILSYTNFGINFVFGPLNDYSKIGFIFAVSVLPVILFMSSLMSILYHLGIMQKVIQATAWVMVKVLGTSGGESLAAAANIFVGQTEAPLVVRPYIGKMTRSELMALMTGGMATVAGSVLAVYVKMGVSAGHLLAASVMSAPASLVCAKLMIPELEDSVTKGSVKIDLPKTSVNIIDAATTGASEGLKLALNVMAMLLVFISLIALVNGVLAFLGGLFGHPTLSLEFLTGYLFFPIAWIMGVPSHDALTVGALLGKKLILNEFVAYQDLQTYMSTMSPRSVTLATYALCGFSNFGSVAIQVGGIGSLAPERSHDLAKLGIRSLIAGTLACLMTACIAGILI